MESKTAMWYQKKEKLINGPTIPKGFFDMTDMTIYSLCSAALNRTHVMMIVHSIHLSIHKLVIFNSEENLWYFISDVQLEYDLEYIFTHCKASVAIDKSGKK